MINKFPEDEESIVDFVVEMMVFLGLVQKEISCALVLDSASSEKLKAQLRMSEEQIEHKLNAVALECIKMFPLETMNGSSMFGRIISLHSNITGNSEMHRIMEKVNEKLMDHFIKDKT